MGNLDYDVVICLSYSHLTLPTRLLHNIIDYTLASKLGHFNKVSMIDFYLLLHLIQGSLIGLCHITFDLMASTLSHHTHLLPHAPIITLSLSKTRVSFLEEPNVEFATNSYIVSNLCTIGFCQQNGLWCHIYEIVLGRGKPVNDLSPNVDIDTESQALNVPTDDVDADIDNNDVEENEGRDSFELQARASGKRSRMTTRATSSTESPITLAANLISILSIELADLHVEVCFDFAIVHASITDL